MLIVRRLLASATLGLSLHACSGGEGENASNEATDNVVTANVTNVNSAGDNAPNAAELPNLSANQTEVAAVPCPEAPGTTCVGPLIVRAEGLNLSASGSARPDGGRILAASGTIVFENRSGGPVRIAVLRTIPLAQFNNGLRLAADRYGAVWMTGILICGNGPECFQGTPDRFTTLTTGDSPARATINFEGRMDGSLAASLPSVASTDITLQVYVVDGANVGNTLNISLPNAPVQNHLR